MGAVRLRLPCTTVRVGDRVGLTTTTAAAGSGGEHPGANMGWGRDTAHYFYRMTSLPPHLAALRDQLVSHIHQLDAEALTHMAEILLPEGTTAPPDEAMSPAETAAFLQGIGMTEAEFLAVAEEGRASIARGEGVSAEDFRREVLSKYQA